jgi:hypothetical protein
VKPQYRSSVGGVQPPSPISGTPRTKPRGGLGPLDPKELGRRSHSAIARAAELGIADDEVALRELARSVWPVDEALIHRLAVRRRIESDLLAFFRSFRRGPEWEYVGDEVPVGACHLDLLWRRAIDGRLEADDIKTGLGPTRQAMERQARRQLRAALSDLGQRFHAVRVCTLGDPRRSLTLSVADLEERS